MQEFLITYGITEILLPLILIPAAAAITFKARAFFAAKKALLEEHIGVVAYGRFAAALDRILTAIEAKAGDPKAVRDAADYLRKMNPGDLKTLGLDSGDKLKERIAVEIKKRAAEAIAKGLAG